MNEEERSRIRDAEQRRREQEEKIDREGEHSFPASDPPSTTHPGRGEA